jgi:hypothetical protein
MLGWTNGENAHEVEAERTQANLEAVAAALKLHDLPPAPAAAPAPPPPPKPEPAPPAIPVEELEAAIEAAHPEHVPEGPAEPPVMVPAFGETPVEEGEAEESPIPAAVVVGQMAAHEPLVEAPVTYFVPPADEEPEPSVEVAAEASQPEPEPLPEVTVEAPEPQVVPVDTVEEELDYIDIEPDPVEPEPQPLRSPKAGGPASAPGVPYKSEVEPAAE